MEDSAGRKKDFLQSDEWRNFQGSTGKRTFFVNGNNVEASIIEHKLPLIGSYFYIPRGIFIKIKSSPPAGEAGKFKVQSFSEIISLAEKEKAGWIRVDINKKEDLDFLKKSIKNKIKKSPHNMQPRQVFMIDISGTEEKILSDMKSKTRYNIRLASKKGVIIKRGKEYIEEFLRLVKKTSERQGITHHPENYYRKMAEISGVEIYVAEFEGKAIASGIVSFYDGVATYLHGASDNDYRNVMAPFLFQWQAILDARERGCKFYDFGGVKTQNVKCKTPALTSLRRGEQNDWSGITRFKLGFSNNAKPLDFMGSYDIVISPIRYALYRMLQKIKSGL